MVKDLLDSKLWVITAGRGGKSLTVGFYKKNPTF